MTNSRPGLLRKEDRSLLTGRGAFVDDMHLDRMVHGVFVRSPFPHAQIRAINIEAAGKAGALAALTARDLPFFEKRLVARYWHPSIRKVLPSLLALDRVRYVGEPVALVIAETRYLAEDFAELVKVDYEPMNVVAAPAEFHSHPAVTLHPEWPGNVAAQYQHKLGDAEAALARAPRRISRSFSFRRQGGLPLETRGCVADFDASRGALTIWISTQTHYAVRMNLAELLGIPESNIQVITGDVGGGFGAKSRPCCEEVVVSHASRVLGRPVKWIEDRLEHMQATTQSRGIDTELELGYDDDGRVLALKGRLLVDIGAYVFTSGIITAEVASTHCCGPYKIPNACVDVICAGTNKTPLATCRGAGQPEATFPLECLLDLTARDVGISGAEIRRRNLLRPEDFPYDPLLGYGGVKAVFESGDFPSLLGRATAPGLYSEAVECGPHGERIAWGLACGMESTGVINFESAKVQVDTAGNVLVLSGLTSQGQGQLTTLGQVCAETLGVDASRVTVKLGDTGLLNFGRGTFASRGAVMGGNAVMGAASKLRSRVLHLAGQLLQCDATTLDLRNSLIVRSDGVPTDLTLQSIARGVQPGGPLYSGDMGLEESFIFDNKNLITLALSIHTAKVVVNVRTGACRVVDYAVTHDAGRLLNRKIVEGQIIGGTVEGIGCTLFSEFVHDDQAQLLTGSLADYLLITAPEAPRVRINHVETKPTTNPLGVRGVGEGGTIAAPAAIVNAILRAIDADNIDCEQELFTLPVKPEAVLRALGKRGKDPKELRR
jgi:aerobic carbon-monoxide dehydrogenase large subunit